MMATTAHRDFYFCEQTEPLSRSQNQCIRTRTVSVLLRDNVHCPDTSSDGNNNLFRTFEHPGNSFIYLYKNKREKKTFFCVIQ